MSDRLAIDSNAVIDLLRSDRANPPLHPIAPHNVLPLPAAGELFAGAFSSQQPAHNLAQLEGLISEWTVLTADLGTARIYGRLRGDLRFPTSASRLNDLWIAAICIQHELPLLATIAASMPSPASPSSTGNDKLSIRSTS